MTQPVTVNAPKRQFTVEEYHRLVEVGILQPNDRVELIQGEIIQMSPIGPKHAGNLDRIVHLLTRLFGESAIIRAQSPVQLDANNEPEPDIAVLRPRRNFYTDRHPIPSDILLIIEIADTTLTYDREVKHPLYAAAGIPEYWIIDLNTEQLIVFSGNKLQEVRTYNEDQMLETSILPRPVSVGELLLADIS